MDNITENSLVDLAVTIEGTKEDYNYNKTSVLQGVLMELINTDYATILHQQGRKPYSQHLEFLDNSVIWHIYTLSTEAYHQIIVPILSDNITELELKHDEKKVKILGKKVSGIAVNELFQRFYSESASNIYRIDFITPTAFKRDGRYCFYPEVYHIYQSLMKRFDEVSDRGNMFNQETLDQLAESTEIIAYSLHSVKFGLEGVRIPSFIGNITIKVHGTQTICNFAKLLFEFGNYSGIGIKTAMGMGGVRITERRIRTNDRSGS